MSTTSAYKTRVDSHLMSLGGDMAVCRWLLEEKKLSR